METQRDDARSASMYPVASGFKTDGASRKAAKRADEGIERKYRVWAGIALIALLEPGHVIDVIADTLMESILYTRPRCSQLVAMGILRKGDLKISPTCGRHAHGMHPSADLLRLVETHNPQDDHELERLVRSFVIEREAAIRASLITAKRGAV